MQTAGKQERHLISKAYAMSGE